MKINVRMFLKVSVEEIKIMRSVMKLKLCIYDELKINVRRLCKFEKSIV